MVIEGDLAYGAEHTIQCIMWCITECTPETYIILLTNVTSISSIQIEK